MIIDPHIAMIALIPLIIAWLCVAYITLELAIDFFAFGNSLVPLGFAIERRVYGDVQVVMKKRGGLSVVRYQLGVEVKL